jgi:hypothetical protein
MTETERQLLVSSARALVELLEASEMEDGTARLLSLADQVEKEAYGPDKGMT